MVFYFISLSGFGAPALCHIIKIEFHLLCHFPCGYLPAFSALLLLDRMDPIRKHLPILLIQLSRPFPSRTLCSFPPHNGRPACPCSPKPAILSDGPRGLCTAVKLALEVNRAHCLVAPSKEVPLTVTLTFLLPTSYLNCIFKLNLHKHASCPSLYLFLMFYVPTKMINLLKGKTCHIFLWHLL
uniref:Putative secreted protein n=1 Tax=Desmodus rotundus TaxID=9430 RepID=K9IG78_DESRO